jgi:polysaccharide export outer membrane protein
MAAKMAMESARSASSVDELNQSLGVGAARDLTQAPADYTIGAQDLLDISLFNLSANDGVPNKTQVRVNNEGQITLPLLGRVQAAGMTRSQLEESLKKEFGKFMVDPDVGVALAENRSKSVYILGAVKSPGVLPVTGNETLRRLLAMAGGVTPDAGMFVYVSRQVKDEERSYVINFDDLAQDKSGKFNLAIQPGDFINVARAGSFYVDGEVQRPNAYPLTRPYTLSQAIVQAGGLSQMSSGGSISVFHNGPKGEMKVSEYDLEKIRAGQQEDIQITENDIIVVPPSTSRVVLNTVIGMLGFSSRSSSFGFSMGRVGGMGGRVIPFP